MRTSITIRLCCLVIVALAVVVIFAGCGDSESDNPTATPIGFTGETSEEDKVNRTEENRQMDMLMWYDADNSPSVSDRPQRGWFPLLENNTQTVTVDGHFRVTTPLLGLYDQRKPAVIRQHLYWIYSLGCNGIIVDYTNCPTTYRDLKGDSFYKFTFGLYKNIEGMLKTASEETQFAAPKITVALRMNGRDYTKLQGVLDDMYALYEMYPDAWYKFDDGTENASKPFIEIFVDFDVIAEYFKENKKLEKDDRFNIRFTNGYLGQYSQENADGSAALSPESEFWYFVENIDDEEAGEGMYKVLYKKGENNSVEQMVAWASVHRGYLEWDELNNKINGKTTFERTLRGVKELSPSALIVARWNYALAWLSQPQEGLSLYESTHIEPNEDFGFLVFDNVKKNLYDINNWKELVPPTPSVQYEFDGTLFIGLEEFPTEYRISDDKDNMGEWVYYNINDGIEIPKEYEGKTCYIQTRNTYGESQIGEYSKQ